MERERWGTRLGLILAMAGNAIGLGNFLRFPVEAASNGGGAFMIPYFISFVLLGIPLMWVEWGLGRYGGIRGHGTAPGMFDALWKHWAAKYIGLLGIFLPLVVLIYYTYICSWTLAFSLSSLFDLFPTPAAAITAATPEQYLAPYQAYLAAYIGSDSEGLFLTPSPWAYFFFLITLAMGMFILGKGIAGGIEKLSKFAIPTLFVLALILFVRVVTLESPTDPTMTAAKAFSFLWEPDLSGLLKPDVWLHAAGQIFFTLSLGYGAILTYASYVRPDEDIVLDGLTTASLNGFAEVVFGSTIAIVSAVIFFGMDGARVVATGGAFKLGLISMPAIFAHMPMGQFFGFLWFLLLFFAGLTSVVALSQPAVAFFEDEFGWTRKKSVITLGVIFFVSAFIPIFIKGGLDEMDFWAGTYLLSVLALFEIVLFFWIFGAEKAWEEINRGARIAIPRVFFYIMKYVTPLFLALILGFWTFDKLPGVLAGGGVGVWITRGFLVGLLVLHVFAIRYAWRRRSVNDRVRAGQ